MYAPERSREDRPEILLATMRAIRTAHLVSWTGDGYHATMAPVVVLHDGTGTTLETHIARPNPHWKALGDGCRTLALFQGPAAYVTPSWYATKAETGRVVPTWTYVAVEAEGRLEPVHDPAWLAAHIDRLTREMEGDRPHPWAVSDAPPDYIAALSRGIVGLRLRVDRMAGSWKLNQHKTEGDRAGVVAGLQADAHPLADLMARVGAEKGAGPGVG